MANVKELPFLDIHIDTNQVLSGAKKVLKVLRPQWAEDEIMHKTFNAGYTNKLLCCYHSSDTDKEDAVIIRCYGDHINVVLDRETEVSAMTVLHSAGCASQLYCRFRNGLVHQFLPGCSLDETSVRNKHIQRLVATEIVKIQSLQPDERYGIKREPVLFTRLKQLLHMAPETFSNKDFQQQFQDVMKSKRHLEQELVQLEEELLRLQCPVVFSHNDLAMDNIIYNQDTDEVKFIDYEFAGFNYEPYDLANHFCEYAGISEADMTRYPDRAYQLSWLKHFLEIRQQNSCTSPITVTDADVETLFVQVNKFALASHFFWALWDLIKSVQVTSPDTAAAHFKYSVYKFKEYFMKKQEYLSLTMLEAEDKC